MRIPSLSVRLAALWLGSFGGLFAQTAVAEVKHFVRYQHNGEVRYGQKLGDSIQPLSGDLFAQPTAQPVADGDPIAISQVELLLPTEAQKVFAVGMNFASHLASASEAPPPLFLKLPTSLIASGKTVQLPPDANNVHFEGELVLVIGKKAKNLTEAQAKSAIFGVTAGNDLTERNWQGSDLQWMRAKASDGFAPLATTITTGVDYNNVLLTTTLNGKVVQQENTRHMIHKPAKVVSYLSQYFTLMPGDLVFMGTPGRTQSLSDGDTVSVRIEGVATVENVIRQ